MAPAQPELKKVRPILLNDQQRVDAGFLRHPLFPLEPLDARFLLKTPSRASIVARLLTLVILMQYLDKRLFVQLNGSRKVIGVLRGYDVFLNIVLDEAVEEKESGEKVRLGMTVCTFGASLSCRL